MSKAKLGPFFDGPPRADNRPLFDWRDETDWFKDEIRDGKIKSGEDRVLGNGYVASYRIDSDGDGFLFVESMHTYDNGLVEPTTQLAERVTSRSDSGGGGGSSDAS